jgi:signal transduction histidine kinase
LSSIISMADGNSGLDPQESLQLVGSIAKCMLEFVNCLFLSLQADVNGNEGIKLFHEYFSVSGFLKEIQSMMSPLAAQKKTRILVDGDPLDMMLTDRTKLTQIVTNFLSNSIKFTPGGTIKLRHERKTPPGVSCLQWRTRG